MSDSDECWELNRIKALSLTLLRSNWIKLEKKLPTGKHFFFFSLAPKLEMLPMFCFYSPIFCPCQLSPNEIPGIRRFAGTRMHERAGRTLSDRHTSHTSTRAASSSSLSSLLKFHIEIPRCHSARPAPHPPGPVTQPPNRRQNQQVSTKTHTHRDTIQTFLNSSLLLPFMCGMKVSFR